MRNTARSFIVGSLVLLLAPFADTAKLPDEASFGPNPTLPEPRETIVPTVSIAPAKGWPAGGKPTPAAGLAVNAFATGLDHPRWLYVLPNGDVLVAETNAPQRPDEGRGIKGWVIEAVQKRGRRRRAERQSHHAAARRRRRRRRRDADGVPRRPELAVRHGAGRRRPLRRQHRRGGALSLPGRRDGDHRSRRRRSPTCRPGRSTITGPRT